jgi:hypothetical protein
MTTDIFCFYLQNRPIQTSQTGSQWYSDTSPFSIPWFNKPTPGAVTNIDQKHFGRQFPVEFNESF